MKVGVFKFSSCDGCQLAFFDIAEDLLKIKDIEILYFLEAQSINKDVFLDVSFVEGSISTKEEQDRINKIREKSKYVVAIGSCAVSGGIQSARNFQEFENVYKQVYRIYKDEGILERSMPISDFIKVDYSIKGCPINKYELVELLTCIMLNKTPNINNAPVCLECKRKGNPCLLIIGRPCLGPITADGCGALCPSFSRGCYGCYGPFPDANIQALKGLFMESGWDIEEFIKTGFNSYNVIFRDKLWR